MIIGKEARDLFKNFRNRYSRDKKRIKGQKVSGKGSQEVKEVQNYLNFSGGLIHISSHARVNQIYIQPWDRKIIVMMIQKGWMVLTRKPTSGLQLRQVR